MASTNPCPPFERCRRARSRSNSSAFCGQNSRSRSSRSVILLQQLDYAAQTRAGPCRHVVAHTVTDDGLAETAELPETNLAVGLVATRIYGQMPQEDAVQVQLVEPVPAQQIQRFTPVSLAVILLLAHQDAYLGGTFLVVDVEQAAVADELLIASQTDVHVDHVVAGGLCDDIVIPGILLLQCQHLAVVEEKDVQFRVRDPAQVRWDVFAAGRRQDDFGSTHDDRQVFHRTTSSESMRPAYPKGRCGASVHGVALHVVELRRSPRRREPTGKSSLCSCTTGF